MDVSTCEKNVLRVDIVVVAIAMINTTAVTVVATAIMAAAVVVLLAAVALADASFVLWTRQRIDVGCNVFYVTVTGW